jgi:hypothetical protein
LPAGRVIDFDAINGLNPFVKTRVRPASAGERRGSGEGGEGGRGLVSHAVRPSSALSSTRAPCRDPVSTSALGSNPPVKDSAWVKSLKREVPTITVNILAQNTSRGSGASGGGAGSRACSAVPLGSAKGVRSDLVHRSDPLRSSSPNPSVQRWVGQPLGIGDAKGRADDMGALYVA